jgi:N-methylhydantoinase A
MAQEAIEPGDVSVRYFVDMWYAGQSYYLEVPLALDDPDPLGRLYRDFLATHDRVYGYATQAPAAIVNLRTIHAVGGAESLEDGQYEPNPGEAEKCPRPILVAGSRTPVTARVFDRERLVPGTRFAGPAIVEQADTTTLLEPGWQAEVAPDGNLLLRPQADG